MWDNISRTLRVPQQHDVADILVHEATVRHEASWRKPTSQTQQVVNWED